MNDALLEKRICVTGGAGFLGRHVVEVLLNRGVPEAAICVPRSCEYDLTRESCVANLFVDFEPDVVIHLAAVVGGIGANRSQPGRFFYANLAMGLHLIEEARRREIQKFVQIGTVCAYPKLCEVPFQEDDLWAGYPEETNAPYGVAKRALWVMLDSYQRQYGLNSAFLLPVNLYGPHDNFDEVTSHVIPALIHKVEEARIRGDSTVECWGTGNASREFLYVADAAEGIVRATERIDNPTPINLGTGEEITIRNLANEIVSVCGYEGRLKWNQHYPDGQPRRCLNTKRAEELLDWRATTPFAEGLRRTIDWYRNSAGSELRDDNER